MNWNPEVEKDAEKSAESALILVDIEGSSGVYEKEQCKTHSEKWKKARHLLTADVNAAIRGLKAAGIVKIIVKDMHASGFNLVRENIENNVRCLQGHFWKPVPLIGKMPQVDVAIMIGWHAGPDQADGFSPLIFGPHQVKMKIPGKTLVWESRSGLDTYRKILAKSVFKPCPELFLPLGLAFYRVWSKMKIMNCKD